MEKPTGISTYARNLLPSLRSLNPILLTSQEIPGYSCYQVPANMTPEQGSLGHFSRLLWTQFQLPKIYRQHRSQLFFSPVTEAPLFAGCRSIVMVHDLIPIRFPRNFSPLTNYTRYWVPLVLRQAEHILCNSYSTAQDITQFFKISSQKITPIPLAYQADHFRFLDLPKQNYFLYLGRIDLYKNVQRLITAFANLPQRSQYQLWIAGPADQRFLPALIAQIERLKLTAQVKFLNYVSYTELPTLINQAIALVFPSLWEGFGLPVLEAMACGTPVIASNLSSLPEFTGKAALLIDPYQVAAITEAMEAVSSDAGLAAQLRDRGLAQANQFSWAKTGAATAAVLQQYL
ncbi:MAG: glycosyltransferase family 4 protein [Scytolyngbya sp. HA4215-MV1]|jgi:glycosyltransferase involved in cell wall biosynthesis|nr:glycosyltransferase family 4 protein [Scytolyngbya sp. HA4215-MV1]